MQASAALVVGAIALQAVLLVLVVADTDVDPVAELARGGVPGEAALHATGEVGPRIGANLDAARRRVEPAVQNGLQLARG